MATYAEGQVRLSTASPDLYGYSTICGWFHFSPIGSLLLELSDASMQPTALVVFVLLGAGSALKLPSPSIYSRRTAVTGGLAAALLPTACRGEEPAAAALPVASLEDAAAAPAPVPPAPPPAPPPPTTITYDALSQRLADCQSGACTVEKVEFSSTSGDAGVAIIGGQRLEILGIPAENPNSTVGPLKLAAKCRDAGVPYTFPFTEFLKKQNAEKQQQAASGSGGGGGLKLPSLPKLF